MPIPRGLTVKDKAYLEASHAALDVPEMQAILARAGTGSEREELLETIGLVARAVIDNVWTTAHQEGHGCKSPFCTARR